MEFREEWALPSQRLRLQFRVLQFQLCSTATEHDANSSYYMYLLLLLVYEGLCIFQQEGATWSGEFAGCSRFPSRVRAVRTSAAGWV